MPGWVGLTGMAPNGLVSNITLQATTSAMAGSDGLQVGFHVWDDSADSGTGAAVDSSWPLSPLLGPGATAQANIGVAVADGHQYSWNAWEIDPQYSPNPGGAVRSPVSATCTFRVDQTPPVNPTTGTIGLTGNSVVLPVASLDPAPTGCTGGDCHASGVVAFRYSLDMNIPQSGGSSVAAVPGPNGTATANIPLNLSPAQWGSHRLYVQAVDAAGNRQESTYDFFGVPQPTTAPVAAPVPVAPAPAPAPASNVPALGDLNGDGVPDLLLAAQDGSLVMVNGAPSGGTAVSATAKTSPEAGTGWNDFLVAHGGSFTGRATDDLFAYSTRSANLYTYPSDSTAMTFSNSQAAVPVAKPACTATVGAGCDGYPSGWTQLTRIAAPGPLAASALRAAGTTGAPLLPDLVTVEGGKLWYYTGGTAASAGYFSHGYPLGTGDWSHVTLLTPGVANGVPTLWARDDTTGAIASYPLAFDKSGNPTSTLTPPAEITPVSALKAADGSAICADVTGNVSTPGALMEIWGCNGGRNQQWTFAADQSVHVMGQCLEVYGNGDTPGSPVDIWPCNGGSNQHWQLAPNGNLVNPVSGLCLADNGGGNAPGTRLMLWNCAGNPDQLWSTGPSGLPVNTLLQAGLGSDAAPTVVASEDVTGHGNPDLYGVDADGTVTRWNGTASDAVGLARFSGTTTLGNLNNASNQYSIHARENSAKCIDDPAGNTANGTPVNIWDCNGGTNQTWQLASDGSLRIGGKCVSAEGGATADGTKAILWDCAPVADQQWTRQTDGSFLNVKAQKCLDINNWDTTNGRQLDVWDCVSGQGNQDWDLAR
ncbi:ricin-type beta-trefoil lectin domain protein [Kitasatospora sp. NPDC006697]|uniref:ricin-type beta-trefoil lectin domain protein n=1 Tax=Kitasatospora sp. NPDC006697 TaxID=3364020 RepID=UPI00369A580C